MRKRWTPKEEVTDSVLRFREKRKWQISLRRYVLEKQPCTQYAPYFGLDIETYRKWIEIQFTSDLSWDNFSTSWQFDHIVPVAYFDFNNEEDLKLCWNFINIRVEQIDHNRNRGNRIDVLAAKTYFEDLFKRTGYIISHKMIEKIGRIEVSQIASNRPLENFILQHKEYIDTVYTLEKDELAKMNRGISIEEIMAERELIKKFGRGK